MGRAKPVVLAGRTFSKQGDAWTYFADMLKRYVPGDRVSADDEADLAELLKRHPQADEKIGCGIDHFEVQEADYDTQCFRVVRTDGTWERFSFHVCVAPDRKWG
ncbi:DCL family protein [Roseomonas eburnea]|uniref:DCL family protein n=1 Tax=Neoroseomonas eburnea TaxID=1346889 RepID=A0A9X9XI17_9PROT|nr:DCL family protein [Neoroseomonas eburnea]MBR0683353.1 DCL family protein [Neoroseomonas eburnea]